MDNCLWDSAAKLQIQTDYRTKLPGANLYNDELQCYYRILACQEDPSPDNVDTKAHPKDQQRARTKRIILWRDLCFEEAENILRASKFVDAATKLRDLVEIVKTKTLAKVTFKR